MEPTVFHGACDASGIVDLGGGFFAAGTDEANVVHVYHREGDGQPLNSLALDEFLEAPPKKNKPGFAECDLEGATRLGDFTLWITSHARDGEGKKRRERRRLFALRIVRDAEDVRLEPVGKPFEELLHDLRAAPELAAWQLEEAAQLGPQAEGGLNIEALCASHAGTLLVGFRNPVRAGRALLAEVLNPLALVNGEADGAEFGPARELDLDGRGLRDLVRWGKGYLLLAGAPDDDRRFALFRWAGGEGPPAPVPVDLNATDLNPEGLLVVPGGVLVLSDDDSVETPDGPNGKLTDESRRTFRGLRIALPETQ